MKRLTISVYLLLLSFSTSFAGEITQEKEVFNFTDNNGTPVFTDMKPKSAGYNSRIIRTPRAPKPAQQNVAPTGHYSIQNIRINKTTTIINNNYASGKRRVAHHKKSKHKTRCESYKARLDKVMGKMRAGYRASEYKKLEKKRVKYRQLLFDKCDTRLRPK